MTREQIIAMAQAAGMKCGTSGEDSFWWEGKEFLPMGKLARFAELARAFEREKMKTELNAVEKWKGIATARFGDGRTVQQIEADAIARQNAFCGFDGKWCEDNDAL